MFNTIIGSEQGAVLPGESNSGKGVTSTAVGSKQALDVSLVNGSTGLETTLLDVTNQAAGTNYYTLSMGAYKNLSLSGSLADANGVSTMTVEVTNDGSTWIQIYGYNWNTNTVVNSIATASSTVDFVLDYENLNFKSVRVKLVNADATNTFKIYARQN